jgi:hypothetical protein
MLLRHATLARNLPGIIKAGLLTAKSKGKLPAVWLCSAARSHWATGHVVRRHGGRIESVVVLEIEVPRSWLKRHGGAAKGLWYSPRDIPPQYIRGIITFGELSRSPLEAAAGS